MGLNTYKLTNRIEVSAKISKNEYEFMLGKLADELVHFMFINTKYGREHDKVHKNCCSALELAYDRAGDGRYRNYEFYIYHI